MTKKKKRTKIPYDKIQYVFNNLSKSELDEFDQSPHANLNVVDLSSELQRLVEKGFKVAIKWDTYRGNGIQITATCDETDYPSSGYATSARSSDVRDALSILIYKIAVLADYDLSSFDNEWKELRG